MMEIGIIVFHGNTSLSFSILNIVSVLAEQGHRVHLFRNRRCDWQNVSQAGLDPRVIVHDFDTKVGHARKFLSAGNKTKVSIRFRGREMTHTDLGLTIMAQFAEKCADIASVEKPAKLEGRQMLMFLAPKSAK